MTPTERIRAHAEAVSDELLDLENACFVKLDDAVARVARAVQQRITAAHGDRTALLRADLLPEPLWLQGVLLPPVGDLLAASRQRALFLVRAQLGELAANDAEQDAAAAGLKATKDAANAIERQSYGEVADRLELTRDVVIDRISEQRRVWQVRGEDPHALVARLCARDRVPLPGTHAHGAVWLFETSMRASARGASIVCTNRLVSAGISGWNAARG